MKKLLISLIVFSVIALSGSYNYYSNADTSFDSKISQGD